MCLTTSRGLSACYCGSDVLHVRVVVPRVDGVNGLPLPTPVVVGGVVIDVLVAEVAITPDLQSISYDVSGLVWPQNHFNVLWFY